MPKDLCAKYYREQKESLQKNSHKRCQNLSKEEKDKNQQYGREQYTNFTKDLKQRLVESRKQYEIRINASQ